MCPAVSKAQQRLMAADLARKRAGKKTKTGMSAKQLEDYAGTPQQGLPEKKGDHSEENARERTKMMGGMPKSHAHMTPKRHKKAMAKLAKKKK